MSNEKKGGEVEYQLLEIGEVCISAIVLASFKATWPFNLQNTNFSISLIFITV